MVASRSVAEVVHRFREAVDALRAVDPMLLADGPSGVQLLQELSRVEAVVGRQAAAFEASGEWELDRAPTRIGSRAAQDAGCRSGRSEERRVGKECRSRWSP